MLRVIGDLGRQHVIVVARHEYGDDGQQRLGVPPQPVGSVLIDPETRIDPDRQARGDERIDRPKPLRLRVRFSVFPNHRPDYPQLCEEGGWERVPVAI